MAVDIPAIREVVGRVCTRQDVIEACTRRDLGAVIAVLSTHGITQGQISSLTGVPQSRLSEYKTHKRIATAAATFEAFADGLGMPPVARDALGLAPKAEESGPFDHPGQSAGMVGVKPEGVKPLLTNLSRSSAVPVLQALREMNRGYIEADRLMGSMFITGPISVQMPVIEKVCEITRGADRAEALRFASQFAEFGGWIFQDAGDLVCAMHWTDRALDYALELGDRRIVAYTLMRKAMIATESGNPAQGAGIANSALEYRDALTPRIRAVILRQRAYSNAVLGEVIASARDSDDAITEATVGEKQGEPDPASYCTSTYAEMEAGASWVLLGHPKTALPILEKSRSDWLDKTEVRDYVLRVSRLAVAYAAAGEMEQACTAAEEVITLARGLGSRRVVSQIEVLCRRLGRWRQDPVVAGIQGRLKLLVDSFQPGREAG